ncbi:uncharacterized protein NPIL_141961 [Nephila pilipes]|uniref:DUF5641 domain-containing protein n=1 Tax=Nephila pilipes TaxID=299642 RepID=A0A8X6IER8_NEPPI|nr:uncharacterized protein NPIL_141961 [Nephila pilipes]
MNPKVKSNLSFHVFCDASQLTYAFCIYLRNENEDGVSCQLVQSRSRVAPLKPVTVSRLELLACTIAVRLMKTIKQDLNMEEVITVYWTNSTNALHWIKRDIVLIESIAKIVKWPLWKVVKLIEGRDGVVLLTKIRTKHGDLLRPIQRLYPLEVSSTIHEDLRQQIEGHTICDKRDENNISSESSSLVPDYGEGLRPYLFLSESTDMDEL